MSRLEQVVPLLLRSLASLALAALSLGQAQEGTIEVFLGEPQLEMQRVFENERFPCIVVAKDGTVIATWGSSSVRARRSEDGGATWGDVVTIASPGFQGGGTTVDEASGDVFAFVEAGHPPAELTVYRSGDHGATWSPQEVELVPNSLGHVHSMHMNDSGITLRHGEHAGRLIRPTRWYGPSNDRAHWPEHYTGAMFSDDGGRTWQTSEPFPEKGTGEATVAELSDGTLYYNSRVHWPEATRNTRRRSAASDDGGRTWKDWTIVDVLPDGRQDRSYGCMGGLVRLPVEGRDVLVFSNLDTPSASRERITVWASFDGGATWPVKRLVYDGPSAYSSLTAGRPNTPTEGWIYLQYEGGPGGGCQVARFNLSWLLEGEATGDGSIPGWIGWARRPIDLGSRRELLVDRHLIDELRGARLSLARPVDEGPVLRFDRPWEGPFSGYSTVIRDGERFLLYYRGLPRAGGDGTAVERTCVAVSSDGVHWNRPELELFEVDGHAKNNVVLADAAPVTHNFSPFLDTRPGVPATQRFKGLGGNEKSGLIAYASPDGLRWSRLSEEPVFRDGKFDSQNVSFWSESEGRYVCYFRTWTGTGYSGYRTVSRTTSSDFVNWTPARAMRFGDAPPEHLYTNQTHPYFRAPHLYVGIAARFMPGRQVVSEAEAERLGVNPKYYLDCSDAVLLTSRGGTRYDRTFLEAFVRPGIGLENWVSRSNYPALNLVRTGEAEMSFYVNQNYAQPTAELRRYSLRLDGLASVRADRSGGELVTHPLTFAGDVLTLNFATSAAGEVRVELQNAMGKPLPGFRAEDCMPLIGNELERRVAWTGAGGPSSDVSGLAGRPVRLRILLSDADLFALRFVGR